MLPIYFLWPQYRYRLSFLRHPINGNALLSYTRLAFGCSQTLDRGPWSDAHESSERTTMVAKKALQR